MSDQTPTADIDVLLAALIAEHAPHGFDGVMRSCRSGCQVYIAAVALDEALHDARANPPE